MRKMLFLAIALLASSLQAKDVKTKIKTVTYEGTKVNLGTNSLKVQFVDKLKGYEKEGYQGMDIQGDTVISCQNAGWISFYTYDIKWIAIQRRTIVMWSHYLIHIIVPRINCHCFMSASVLNIRIRE